MDVIVTDWIWVATQRKLGHNFTFVPFSRSVGAVMADPAKGDQECERPGRASSIGIAGGPSDRELGAAASLCAARPRTWTSKDKADVQFGAPPLLNELVQRGKLDAVLNFWNFNARLKAKGFEPVISIGDILPALGLDADPPLLGWVFSDRWAADNPKLARGLVDASYEAKALLKSDDAVWDRLRPIMDAEDDAMFQALKAGYREGIPTATSARTSRRRKRLRRHAPGRSQLGRQSRGIAGRHLLVRLSAMSRLAGALPLRLGAGWNRLPSLVALLLLWQVAATLVADAALLPSPLATLQAGYAELMRGELLRNVAITLARVAVAFALAMLIGSAIGIMLGRSPVLDQLFNGWLVIGLNLPALVTMVLCYMWFGLTEVAAILAVTINKVPTVAAIVREGTKALDRSLLEMTQVFGVKPTRVLMKVILPQLAPSLMAAARAGLALTWKIVLVVELLGRPNGVGFQIRTFFNFFDIASILAYSLTFIAAVIAIEAFILQPLDRRLGRWRRA